MPYSQSLSGLSGMSSLAFSGKAPFVSRWQTSNTSTGSSLSNQVALPLVVGGDYRFSVDWGDDSSDEIISHNQAEITHTYASPGEYTISIYGKLNGWRFAGTKDKLKILEVVSWGILQLGDFNSGFFGCSNLTSIATDLPGIAGATNLNALFGDATLYNQDISGLNVSLVTTMRNFLKDATSFDQDLGGWNISNVVDMGNFLIRGQLSTANYDSLLNGWLASGVQDNVPFHAGNSQYSSSGAAARASLIGDHGWTITDGGLVA